MTEKEIVGMNIRRVCAESRISLRQLSFDLKMNRSWLHDIVEGRANVTIDMLLRIADALGVTVRDLLEPPKKSRKSREYSGAGKG